MESIVSRNRLRARPAHPPGQTSAAYTPDGQRLITAGVNNAIRVYKTGSDGEPVNVDDCQESNTAVAATNDFFITGSEDGTVCQYSLETHTLDKVLVRCTLPIRDVAISPNGTWVAVASDELVVKVVNVEDMTRIVFLREQQKPVKHVSFHPDGTLLAASCTDGIIYMYSLSNEEDPELVKKIDGLIRNLETDAEASSRVAWHPDGRAFAVPTATRDIQIVSRNDWEKQRAFTGGHRGDITDISWSPNGAILATAGADRHILLWDSPTQKIIAKYDFANILSIAWHPTENLMSFSNSDGEVYIYEDFVPPDHASLMYRPLQPAPFIHDPNATRGKALPSRGRDAVPQQRARGRTPDSLNDILGSDMDEDQDDFLVDDDGAGYGDGTNTHGKRSNGHLDTLSRPNGKRRATDDSFRSRTHDSFQPGSTSWRGNRRYLCLNLIGSVWTVDQESHHTVTVDFYDRTSHRDFHFTDPYLYDKACLTTHGSLFSCPPTATAPAHLYYRPHSPWTSTRTDFRTPLPPGERILSISLTTSYIIAATSNSYIRIYTPYGTPLSVHRAKSSQTVTIASSGDHLFTIGNGPVDAFTGAAQLTYTITNLRRDEVCQANDIVALPAADSEDQQYEDDASFAGIKTALFSAEGDPCIYDNTGVLLVLLHWRQAGQARWVPLLDTKRLRRLASGRKEETYWPVGVAGGKFHCIILKGGDRSPYFPRPLLSEFPFDLPLHPPPAPGDTPTEGTEDGPEREQHQGEREVEKLEQSHGLATLLLKLEEDRIEGRNAPSDQDLRNVMRKGIEVDKLLLQLLAVECRGGEERGMKALDLVKRLKDDGEDGKMLEAAIKIADRFGRENLAAKIRTLAEDRLLGVITADDEDESEGL